MTCIKSPLEIARVTVAMPLTCVVKLEAICDPLSFTRSVKGKGDC